MQPTLRCLLAAAVLLALVPPSLPFSHGASHASCPDMVPGHISAQPLDPQRNHIALRTSASSYLPGQLLTGESEPSEPWLETLAGRVSNAFKAQCFRIRSYGPKLPGLHGVPAPGSQRGGSSQSRAPVGEDGPHSDGGPLDPRSPRDAQARLRLGRRHPHALRQTAEEEPFLCVEGSRRSHGGLQVLVSVLFPLLLLPELQEHEGSLPVPYSLQHHGGAVLLRVLGRDRVSGGSGPEPRFRERERRHRRG